MRSRRIVLAASAVALIVLFSCGVLVAACSFSQSTTTTTVAIPQGWQTIHGGSVSLALPASFEGGDPQDSEVAGSLDELSGITGALDSSGYDLVAVGEPNAEGHYPTVAVELQSGISEPLGDMQEIVGTVMGNIEAAGYTVHDIANISSTVDRSEFVVSFTQSDGGEMSGLARMVVLKGASWLCMVTYNYDDSNNTSLDEVFKLSARTIEVDAE